MRSLMMFLFLFVIALGSCSRQKETNLKDSGPKPLPLATEFEADSVAIQQDGVSPHSATDEPQREEAAVAPQLALGWGVTCAWTASESHCWGIAAVEHASHIVGADQVIVSREDGCALRNGSIECWSVDPDAPMPTVPLFDDIVEFSRQGLELHILREGGEFSATYNDEYPTHRGSKSNVTTYLWKGDPDDYFLLYDNGSMSCWFDDKPCRPPLKNEPISMISKDSEGRSSCVVLKSGGMRCAENPFHLGDGPLLDLPAFTQLVVDGHRACVVLKEDGKVACWGHDYSGSSLANAKNFRVLDGFEDVRSIAIDVHLCATLNDGRILCEGSNSDGELGYVPEYDVHMVPQTIADLDDVKKIAVERHYGCALLGDSSVWCWGNFDKDGDDSPTKIIDDVADFIGRDDAFMCVIRKDTSLWCWNARKNEYTATQKIESGVRKFAPSRRGGGGCALSVDDEYQCWNVNAFEDLPGEWTTLTSSDWTLELNDPNDDPYEMSRKQKRDQIVAVDVGTSEPCMLTKAKNLYCCDRFDYVSNPCQQRPHQDVKVKMMAIDFGTVCALTRSNKLWCWRILDIHVNDTPFELEVKRGVAEILISREFEDDEVLGEERICVRYKSGSIECGDENGLVPIEGISDATQVAFGDYSCALHKTGQVSCWGQLEEHLPMYDEPTLVEGLDDIVQVAVASRDSACALTADGEVKCWGRLGHGGFAFEDKVGPMELPWRDFFDEIE